MTNYWDQPGIPHKGWEWIDAEDAGDLIESCRMCGKSIRYVHIMSHPEQPETLGVGCVCASKMTGDYTNPQNHEKKLRNRAGRKARWLKRAWRVSYKGNSYLNVDGHNISIFQYKKGANQGKFGYRISDAADNTIWSQKAYPDVDQAKLASFDDFWKLTNLEKTCFQKEIEN